VKLQILFSPQRINIKIFKLPLPYTIMAESAVYSIRIDPRIRSLMEEMKDEDIQADIRSLIEIYVKRKRKEQLLQKATKICSQMSSGPGAVSIIREDRDG